MCGVCYNPQTFSELFGKKEMSLDGKELDATFCFLKIYPTKKI